MCIHSYKDIIFRQGSWVYLHSKNVITVFDQPYDPMKIKKKKNISLKPLNIITVRVLKCPTTEEKDLNELFLVSRILVNPPGFWVER